MRKTAHLARSSPKAPRSRESLNPIPIQISEYFRKKFLFKNVKGSFPILGLKRLIFNPLNHSAIISLFFVSKTNAEGNHLIRV